MPRARCTVGAPDSTTSVKLLISKKGHRLYSLGTPSTLYGALSPVVLTSKKGHHNFFLFIQLIPKPNFGSPSPLRPGVYASLPLAMPLLLIPWSMLLSVQNLTMGAHSSLTAINKHILVCKTLKNAQDQESSYGFQYQSQIVNKPTMHFGKWAAG